MTQINQAFEGIFSAAEYLRCYECSRIMLAEAYTQHLSRVDANELPDNIKEEFGYLVQKLTVPEDSEAASSMGDPHQAVKYLSNNELEIIFTLIFHLEEKLRNQITQCPPRQLL